MNCCWKELLELLPVWLRTPLAVRGEEVPFGEIRLSLGMPPRVVDWDSQWCPTNHIVTCGDLNHVINAASQMSPYASQTIAQGFVTAKGGHRVGLCGSGILRNGNLEGIKFVRSLCIRVARDIPVDVADLVPCLQRGSVLLVGPPGSGKTTLLRNLIRLLSQVCRQQVCVIDEREELFPPYYGGYYFPTGTCVDVMSGIGKEPGIEMAVRTMSPEWVAVDEITSERDCIAMERSSYSGVSFVATAHGKGTEDLKKRPVYRTLLSRKLFQTAVILDKPGQYKIEELN